MPLYDYACAQCGQTVEVRHGFNETHQDPCAACGAPMRRVFNAAPVLFKGSGFYVTDSRRSAAGGKSETPDKAEKPASEASAPADKAAPDKAPADKTPTDKTPAKSEPKASEPAA